MQRTRNELTQDFIDWASDKPIALAPFAITVASSAEMIFQLMQLVGDDPKHWPRPNASMYDDWNRYWESAESWAVDIAESLSTFEDEQEQKEFLHQVRVIARWLTSGNAPNSIRDAIRKQVQETTLRQAKSASNYFRRLLRIGLNESLRFFVFKDKIEDQFCEEELDHLTANNASVLFLMRVVAPCIAEEGRAPWGIFDKAVKGDKPDFQAIETLVRIDKQVIHDRYFRHFIEDPVYQQAALEIISPALLKNPAKRHLQWWKYRVAGLIRHAFLCVGYKIEEPDMRKLFDLIAKANGKGQLDPVIAPAQESFAKALQRHGDEEKWDYLKRLDSETLTAVRGIARRVA